MNNGWESTYTVKGERVPCVVCGRKFFPKKIGDCACSGVCRRRLFFERPDSPSPLAPGPLFEGGRP